MDSANNNKQAVMSFMHELKRRKVIRVAVAYVIVAWLIAQVTELALDSFAAPVWVIKTVLFLLVVGFPLALIFAWAFELTPKGIKLDKDIAKPESNTKRSGRKFDIVIIGMMSVAIVYLVLDKYVLEKTSEAEIMLEDARKPTPAVESATTAVVGSDTASLSSIRSLAVLPFDNLSGDPDQAYVAAGMTDVLTTMLGTVGSLRVISRQSTVEFRGSSESPAHIASELGVDALISGSLLQVGDDVRIIAQLVDAQTGTQLWSDSFDGTAGEIFALQSDTALAIANEIQLTLTAEEERKLEKKGLISPEAWDLYFRGRYHREDYTENGMSLAIESFSGALELEPEFSLAHAGLAQAYVLAIQFGHLPSDIYALRARAEAEEAIRLDPALAEAHISIANLVYRGGRDWEGLEERFRRAIELNADLADVWHIYSHFLTSTLRVDEAVDAALRGIEADPLSRSMRLHLAVTYSNARRWNDVIAVAQDTIERFPHYSRIRLVLGYAYIEKMQFADALAQFTALVAVSRESDNLLGLAFAHASAGNNSEARKLLDELLATEAPPYHIGIVYAALGEMNLAFEWMERAVDSNQGALADLLIAPGFDSFRADPTRWRALLVQAGFAEELIEQAMTRR
jgi:TolB-like protein/Tfp pilus assembly protein PilF